MVINRSLRPSLTHRPDSSIQSKRTLVENHLPLARRCVNEHTLRDGMTISEYLQMVGTLDMDDFYHTAVVGLCDAAKSYGGGSTFESFAKIRINGEIGDLLRMWNQIRVGLACRHVTWLRTALSMLESRGVPTDEDLEELRERGQLSAGKLARRIGTDPEDIRRARNSADATHAAILATHNTLSFQEITGESGDYRFQFSVGSEDDMVDAVSNRMFVGRLLKRLTERERAMIEARYFQGLEIKEIGAIHGVDESRVSQIITKALKNLRNFADALLSRDGVCRMPVAYSSLP